MEKGQVDLAILGIVMPNVSGADVLRFIKEVTLSTKVLMLTAYVNLQHALESKRAGTDDFMGEPFYIDKLKQTVWRLVSEQDHVCHARTA